MPTPTDPTILNKRKILAQLIFDGDGVPDLTKIQGDLSSSELRSYLNLLPLNHPVKVWDQTWKVAEVQPRPESKIPDQFKDYYKTVKNLPRVRTLN